MKNILLLLFSIFSYALSAQIQGGAGVCHVNIDPDNISALQIQNDTFDCHLAWDRNNQVLWVYDPSLNIGNRWNALNAPSSENNQVLNVCGVPSGPVPSGNILAIDTCASPPKSYYGNSSTHLYTQLAGNIYTTTYEGARIGMDTCITEKNYENGIEIGSNTICFPAYVFCATGIEDGGTEQTLSEALQKLCEPDLGALTRLPSGELVHTSSTGILDTVPPQVVVPNLQTIIGDSLCHTDVLGAKIAGTCVAKSSLADGTSVWNNPDGSPATELSTDIGYTNGNIGIGTNSPSYRLDVHGGQSRFYKEVSIGTYSIPTTQYGLTIGATSNSVIAKGINFNILNASPTDGLTRGIAGQISGNIATSSTKAIELLIMPGNSTEMIGTDYRFRITNPILATTIGNSNRIEIQSNDYLGDIYGVYNEIFNVNGSFVGNAYAGYFDAHAIISGAGKNWGIYVKRGDNYFADKVGIGTILPLGKLDVTSTNSGIVFPRVANTSAVTVPDAGETIFDLSDNKLKTYNGTTWQAHW